MLANSLGNRIRTRRNELGYKQAEICRRMGFEGSRTLSAIETGERKVSAEELVRLTEVLEAPLEYFTDPFRLVGEGSFTWRQNGVAQEVIENCERQVGGLVALFRELGAESGRLPPVLRRSHEFSKSSNIMDAAFAGEKFAHDCGLVVEQTRDERLGGQNMQAHGDVQARESAKFVRELSLDFFESNEYSERRLRNVMERDLGILVLMIDGFPGICSAACRLDDLNSVIINRNQPSKSRNYELAHQLFHILTWDALPPERIEHTTNQNEGLEDQLARSFATRLLMSTGSVEWFRDWQGMPSEVEIIEPYMEGNTLRVASREQALGVVDEGMISNTDKTFLSFGISGINERQNAEDLNAPPLFSRPFLELLAESINRGRISIRRAARLLEFTVDDLPNAFHAYDVEFQLGI